MKNLEGVVMNALSTEIRPDGVAIVTFDVPGQPHNTLSPELLEEVRDRVTPVLEDEDVRAVVLASGKPESFIVGADLKILARTKSEEEAARLSREGNALLAKLAASRKPVVAAIHGPALGGGLEVALACHFILASDDPATILGLPEVQLGLLPAGGGTQRLPRRVGLTAALPMLLQGTRVRARRALQMGLVDLLTTPGGMAETAARAALLVAEGKLRRRRPRRSPAQWFLDKALLRGVVLRKARQAVDRQTRKLYPAPYAILECVERGLSRGIEAGLELEARHFGRLVMSPESRALVALFHATNELKKHDADTVTRPVRRMAVLGAGFMGSGIASVSLGQCPVVVRDVSDEALSGAGRVVDEGLRKQVRSGAIPEVERERRLSRLLLTRDVEDLRGCDLVIEAVFEDLDLKHRVLAEAEERIAEDAIFASNTSAIPIREIAAKARHPERVLGMHYFSPVPKMPLLELIAAEQTAPWAVETARRFGIAQGKTVVVVGDGPGFYTSRILAPYLNEAMVLLEEGARIEDVDRAARDFGFPVGPITLLDEVGIDVGAHVSKDLGDFFSARGAAPSGAMQRLFEAGYKGRKNRKGFYSYTARKRRGPKQVNPEVYAFFGGSERRDMPPGELQDRMVLLMVNEAVRCLEEGILACARDGDVAAVLGLGFAPMRGGPFRYVDRAGCDRIVARMEELTSRHGARFRPCEMLQHMARAGERFYPEE